MRKKSCLSSGSVILFKITREGPLQGPESGLLSNTLKWIVQGDTCTDKAKGFIGKGCQGREQQGKGTQENCSTSWLAVSGFMEVGLVFRLSLANHLACAHIWFHSRPSLVAHAYLSEDGFQHKGFWEVGRTYYGLASAPSFWPSQILLVGFGGSLSVPCSLSGPPVVRQFMQVVIFMPGQGEWFWSTVPYHHHYRLGKIHWRKGNSIMLFHLPLESWTHKYEKSIFLKVKLLKFPPKTTIILSNP